MELERPGAIAMFGSIGRRADLARNVGGETRINHKLNFTMENHPTLEVCRQARKRPKLRQFIANGPIMGLLGENTRRFGAKHLGTSLKTGADYAIVKKIGAVVNAVRWREKQRSEQEPPEWTFGDMTHM